MGERAGSVEVVIKGGRPWGFTLQGGIENRSALTVSQIEPSGKADRQGVLRVGDHVIKINDVQCLSLADALQLIDCAFRTLTVLVWRSGSSTASDKDDMIQRGPCISDPKTPTPKTPAIRQSARVKGSSRKSPSTETRKSSSALASSRRPAQKSAHHHHQLDPALMRNGISVWGLHQTTGVDMADSLGQHGKNVTQGSVALLEPLTSERRRRLSSVSTASSSVASHKDMVFLGSEYPTQSRSQRSPRKLTKDSGYETSAPGEPDYVNADWITAEGIKPPTPVSVSESHTEYSRTSFQTDESKLYHPKRPSRYSHGVQSSNSKNGSYQYPSTGGISRSVSCYSSSESLSLPPVNIESRHLERTSSRHSSTDSLASWSSSRGPSALHSTKSSSSLALNQDFCHHSAQFHSTSRHYSNYLPYSDQPLCSTNVSPARSVPNLDLEADMVTRRFNKKPSVYEALANKSGLDFAPVIHRQPYWSRRDVFEDDPSARHTSRIQEKKRYADDHKEAGPRSLPSFGEKNLKSEADRYYNPKNHDPKRDCFQKRIDPMVSVQEHSNNVHSILDERTISPPLIPTRDSSLRYRASSAHEKYPSWPVSLPETVEVCQQVNSSNHRSNSWTESSVYPKENNTSYSRPKRMFQISTQQLHPVQEKTSESSNRRDSKGNAETFVQSYRSPEIKVEKYKNSEAELMEESISKYFDFESVYTKSKSKPYVNNRYNAHSPPERDTTVCTSADDNKSCDDEEYAKKYGDMLRYYSQSPALYGNWNREPSHTSVSDSNTPLLDRLRQERQALPSAWQPSADGDSPSEAGTCTESIDSNSSSQETLKWHGSYSDLCSQNVPTSDSSVFGDSEHSSVVDIDHPTPQYKLCPSNCSSSLKPEALKCKEIVTHAPWVETSEKHHSAKNIPNSPSGHKPPQEQVNFRCAEVEVSQSNVPDPSSPAKNSGIYFYENRIKMLREENRNPAGTQVFQTSFPGFSKSSSEEIRDPPPVPLAKPSKSFREPKGAKGHDSTNQSSYREKIHIQPTKSNSRSLLERKDSYCGFYTAKGWPVRRSEYYGDQSRKHRVSDPELKAIQKQAVLSFYHRQTALESGDWSDTKSDRSSIGNRTESLESPTSPVGNRIIFSGGPSSFAKKPLPEIPPKPASLLHDISHSNNIHRKEACLADSLSHMSDSNISICSSLRSSRLSLVSDFSEASYSNAGLQDCGLNSVYENISNQPVHQTAHTRESKESKPSSSSNPLWSHGGGRKAHFKKIYNSNETAVVKVISSEGVTIVETVEASDIRKNGIKPQVPPKKIGKILPQSPPASTTPPSTSTSTSSAPASSSSTTDSLVNLQDPEEDEELRLIEESFQNHMKLAMFGSSSSSPDLPLPPPPSNTDTEVLHTDDPLPPPPSEVSSGDCVQLSEEQDAKVESPTAPSCITYPQMEISRPPNPTAEPEVIDHQLRVFLPHVLVAPSTANESTYENVPNSKCHFVNENPVERDFSSEASAVQDLSPSCGPDLSPSSLPPLLDDIQGKDCQRLVREIEEEREEELEEALYVNLDLLRLRVQNGDAYELIPNGSETCPSVSVTNSATQTSDTTPSLPRKPNKVGKSQVELECERLSRDFVNHFGDTALRNLLLPAPNHKTMSDYMEGLLELDLEKGTKPVVRSAHSNRNLHDHISQPSNDTCRSNVGLPLTSAYFTTSEPKAKLLTRYCHNLEKKDWTNGIELYGRKEELVASIGKKLEILRSVQISLQEEVDQNEQLGKEVTAKVEQLAKPNELEKYKLHIEELEKIINLLLSLSGRLARAQNALLILPKDAKAEERNILEAKRDKLSEQHEEARRLKENIDRRSQQVSMFLHQYLSKDEYADYDHFIKMKSKLLMDAREIDEKIKLGEEQLAALRSSMDSHVWNGAAFNLLSNGQQIILNRT